MPDFESLIATELARKSYEPLKPRSLARKLGVQQSQYGNFRRALRNLFQQGRAELGKNQTIRQSQPHGASTGLYRRTASGLGFVRPHAVNGHAGPEILVREEDALDAATGDEVLVRVVRKPNRPGASPTGHIMQVVERATRQFVGTYFERAGEGLVRVDGGVFRHSVYVGD